MRKIFFKVRKIMLWIFLVLISLIILILLIIKFHPAFGGKSSGEDLVKIENSPNYQNEKFQNFEEINLMSSEENEGFWKRMGDFFFKDKEKRKPKNDLLTGEFNSEKYLENYENEFLVTWFGHSTILMKTGDLTIITDPIFSKRASPVSWIGPKKFPYENDFSVEDLPKIDVVLISHDHYDHLDYKTILKLKDKVKKFYVPLGVKAHLLRWKVPEQKIEVFDWYDEKSFGNVDFIFTPSQHFSGRSINDSMETLWGSWVIKNENQKIFFSGDTGYFEEFKKIGEKFGPFDFAFVEAGAYNKQWSKVHMFPEETVQVAKDLDAKILMPIHNSKFSLAMHGWKDPLNRVLEISKEKNINLAIPKIGETFIIGEDLDFAQERWWKEL